MSVLDTEQSSINFENPQWVAENGGWIHANNVLFYFATSPFYDTTSANSVLIEQCQGIPEFEFKYLATRKKFEAALLDRPGIQYVVEVDPLETPSTIKGRTGPDGKVGPDEASNLWVIRKQNRLEKNKPDAIKILDYYYIMNNWIFQAPRLDSILKYRVTNSLLAVDKIIKKAAELPVFSASEGHTYFRPGMKPSAIGVETSTQQSRLGTPMPGVDAVTQIGDPAQDDEQQSDERTLREALGLWHRYGKQYYDEAPLIGEPGNFRYAKGKDPVSSLRAAEASSGTRSAIASKATTPTPSQQVKANPTPTSPTSTQKSTESTEQARPKPKRKKSLAVNEAT